MSIGRISGSFRVYFTYKSLNQKPWFLDFQVRASQLRGSGGVSPRFPNIPLR
jgi:hypothetical protein